MIYRGCLAGVVLALLTLQAYGKDFTATFSVLKQNSSLNANSNPTGGNADRWSVAAPGVLLDGSTGLQWTRHDNGADSKWSDSTTYCSKLQLSSRGWRLPTVDELAAIYDENAESKPCWASADGQQSYSCKTSGLFDLAGVVFWSATRAGDGRDSSSQAWTVHLDNGARSLAPVFHANGRRALCVRRS